MYETLGVLAPPGCELGKSHYLLDFHIPGGGRYLHEVPLEPPSPFCSRIEGLGMVFVMVLGAGAKREKLALGSY